METSFSGSPLQVDILKNGKVVKTLDLTDPRVGFIREFNGLHPDGRLVARPHQEEAVVCEA